jgi:Dolichyl-phosphate-mannose-protein mannosyltransferase
MNRQDAIWLTAAVVVFLACHIPLEYRTGAGQDEDWYGVIGITTLRNGIPSVPYQATTDPKTVPYKSDIAVYALPPMSAYFQAFVHSVLGEGLGQARMASTLAGLGAFLLVYALARLWFEERRVALFAATAFLLSRAFLFPATMARPDMATATCGLFGIWSAARHRRELKDRWLVMAGIGAGLALLGHPFGMVPAVQCGLAILAEPGGFWRRMRNAAYYSIMALGIFGLWVPLIALHPDIFQAQFTANVLARAAPALAKTAVAPQSIFRFQVEQFARFVHAPQFAAYLAGCLGTLILLRNSSPAREFAIHTFLASIMLATLQGRHPAIGYYVYPVAFLSIGVGLVANGLANACERVLGSSRPWARTSGTIVAVCLLIIVFVPGAGLKAVLANLQHTNDPLYNSHVFARAIMADIPEKSLVAAEGPFVMDFFLARRPVVNLMINPLMNDVRESPFDYAVMGRFSLENYKPMMNDLIFIKSYGKKNDIFAPYAELYRRDKH